MLNGPRWSRYNGEDVTGTVTAAGDIVTVTAGARPSVDSQPARSSAERLRAARRKPPQTHRHIALSVSDPTIPPQEATSRQAGSVGPVRELDCSAISQGSA